MCRDDAVFHDNFLSLFPEYWQKVPEDFQFVFLGHVYWGSVWDDAIVHLGPRTSPWSVYTSLLRFVRRVHQALQPHSVRISIKPLLMLQAGCNTVSLCSGYWISLSALLLAPVACRRVVLPE